MLQPPTCTRMQSGVNVIYSNNNDIKEIDDSSSFNSLFSDEELFESKQKNTQKNIEPTKKKYNINSLFWIIDEEHIFKKSCQILNISHNADFGNLRYSFYNFKSEKEFEIYTKSRTLFYNNLINVTNITLYPTDCYKLLHEKCQKFECFEPLFKTGEDWQFMRPKITIEKCEDILNITINDNDTEIVNTYGSWEYDIIKHACIFAINGGFEVISTHS